MVRKLATASLVALLALLTLSVVWAGLNWPPPLWIVEYGLPGSQGPTGRVARIEGIEFVVVLAGYHSVPFSNGPSIDGVTDRITAVLFPARFSLPSAIYVSRPPSFALHLPTGGTLESRYARLGWVEIPRPVWVATGVTCRAVERPLLVKRNAGIPMRTATDSEGRVAEFWHGRRARSGGASWLSWREVRIVLWDADQGGALAFSLTPDQEHHLKRYLAEED